MRDMNASARVSLTDLMCWSCRPGGYPSNPMPWRRRCSRFGSCWITRARSLRLGLALAAHSRSVATCLSEVVSSCLRPYLTLATASTSTQTLNRKSRTSSRTGTSSSSLRSSMVYWTDRVSFCSTCCATLTKRLALPFSLR
ncbi:hypothetical protein D9M69_538570 [compost metagenome]